MSIIEVDGLAKTFRSRERQAGLAGSLRAFVAPRYRERKAVKAISEEAQALCERIAIIDHGKLIAVDTPDHLKQTYGGSVVELETATPSSSVDAIGALEGVKQVKQDGTYLTITTQGITNVVPQIINIISQEGEIRNISVREPNLDEVFLRLTGTALRD